MQVRLRFHGSRRVRALTILAAIAVWGIHPTTIRAEQIAKSKKAAPPAACASTEESSSFFKTPDTKDIPPPSAEWLSSECGTLPSLKADQKNCESRCKEASLKGFESGYTGQASLASLPDFLTNQAQEQTAKKQSGIPEKACQAFEPSERNPASTLQATLHSCCMEGFRRGLDDFKKRILQANGDEGPESADCLFDFAEGLRFGGIYCEFKTSETCDPYDPKVCHLGCYSAGFHEGLNSCLTNKDGKSNRLDYSTMILRSTLRNAGINTDRDQKGIPDTIGSATESCSKAGCSPSGAGAAESFVPFGAPLKGPGK